MPHLYKFREGWQNEHFAKYILSKFSFVAEPSTISDDLGSDFFCTLFDIVDKNGLFPKNSFAIQIKSSRRNFNITNKTSYLSGLETPFFVGVVDRVLQKLTIYSGECVSNFFSHWGNPHKTHKIYIELVDSRDEYPMYYEKNKKCFLKFPKVLDIEAGFDYTKNPHYFNELARICNFVQLNISSRKNGEYIFQRYDPVIVDIFAGSGSATSFRGNFQKRLAEVFSNLRWLYVNNLEKANVVAEFNIYKKIYLELKKSHSQLQPYLVTCFEELNMKVNNELVK